MLTFTKDHVIILPHAEEYRALYGVTLDDVLLTLNTPELHEGVSSDRYTAERTGRTHRVYLYYFLTQPLQAKTDALYAIIDFISLTPLTP
jgi:hypothetical protein